MKAVVGTALVAFSFVASGCSLIFVPKPEQAAKDPESSCAVYTFWPVVDMTAALVSGLAIGSALYSPHASDDARLQGALGAGALATTFTVSGLVGLTWIERCKRLKEAEAATPVPTLRVEKRKIRPDVAPGAGTAPAAAVGPDAGAPAVESTGPKGP